MNALRKLLQDRGCLIQAKPRLGSPSLLLVHRSPSLLPQHPRTLQPRRPKPLPVVVDVEAVAEAERVPVPRRALKSSTLKCKIISSQVLLAQLLPARTVRRVGPLLLRLPLLRPTVAMLEWRMRLCERGVVVSAEKEGGKVAHDDANALDCFFQILVTPLLFFASIPQLSLVLLCQWKPASM